MNSPHIATTNTAAADRRGSRHGPAIVFVHGFLDDALVWGPVVETPTLQKFETHCIDLAGVGSRVSEAGPFTLERFARDVAATIDDQEEACVLVGQSMGALVAELAAQERPDAVAALVLVTPVPLAGTNLTGEAAASFRSLGGDAAGQRAGRAQLTVSLDADTLDRLADEGARLRPDVVEAYFDAWNEGHPAGNLPSSYTGPTLIVRGDGDGFVTEDLLHAAVIPRFAQVQVRQIAGAGHWPHLEQPQALATMVSTFVSSLNTAGGRAE
ncbi:MULTISPECIES: alpha/beta fold hydrolase [unclassified Rhodococcus (in: high G+C Gram-positive bacteria)]|uniref:alpha/beta fold hydrolase n=1 Tax=unclassified Rhodococcus (in: high G+C Gram-positive bacteria) TaxID=192944 RepID=UPI0016399F37|nr:MULTISPECIES: alpha/beta hydrolase [unclassified Rhodococcus (in: high G+C Gram-positive bacteria)]MBC2637930.1 alpha/beta hydrolase [Rhodococcus sp. 3A]MBC2897323.1 alpha/beta hydrolase [Rhodococcus sp. 4CII]